MGPRIQIGLFLGIVVVFAVMGVVFWLIGQRELQRQQEASRVRRRASVADAVAIFELAALTDRVVLDARRHELERDLAERKPGIAETVVVGEPAED